MEYQRVRYKKSPLVEVIFQLRFPTILAINAHQPVDFQNSIRTEFPYYEEQLEENRNIVLNAQQQSVHMQKVGENKNYAFVSADTKTKVNLTPSFIAVSTLDYTQWEDFRETVYSTVRAFEAVYQPSFYTRVGLRYVDVITRTQLDLEGVEWKELMNPAVLGLAHNVQEQGIRSFLSEVEYATNVEGVLSKAHIETVHVNNAPETSILIDCDYYSTGVMPNMQVPQVSELLHDASNRFIQMAITEKLHQAMEPELIPHE